MRKLLAIIFGSGLVLLAIGGIGSLVLSLTVPAQAAPAHHPSHRTAGCTVNFEGTLYHLRGNGQLVQRPDAQLLCWNGVLDAEIHEPNPDTCKVTYNGHTYAMHQGEFLDVPGAQLLDSQNEVYVQDPYGNVRVIPCG